MGDFLSRIEEPRIVAAIHAAELRSRGEIRVHITEGDVKDVMKDGAAAFERLGMTATAERNGVLIFIAAANHQFAVLGDIGVTSKVGTEPLSAIADSISSAFRDARFTDGLVAAIEKAGDLLSTHYPREAGAADADELSNEISRG